jgi:hypothetical protein
MIRLLFLLTLFSVLNIYGQRAANSFAFSIGYYGDNFIHPGISLDGYYNYNEKKKTKERLFENRQEKRGHKVKTTRHYLKAGISTYSHPNNHQGWIFTLGDGFERVKHKNGNVLGYQINYGYVIRSYKLPTYSLINGKIETIKHANSQGFYTSLSPVFGRDLFVLTDFPIKTYFKPSIIIEAYNHAASINSSFEIAFIYAFNQSLKHAK